MALGVNPIQTIMNDIAIITVLFIGIAITLLGIGIQLFSGRKTPKDGARFHSSSAKTSIFILKLILFSISIVLIKFGIQTYSTKMSVIDDTNSFEGDIREKNK